MRVPGVEQAPLRHLLQRACRRGVISFAVGLPANELLPAEAIARAAGKACRDDRLALQYGLPVARLKSHVVELMAQRGVTCGEEQVFLTTGAQQAMDLLTRLLVKTGDSVILEEKVYDGISLALRSCAPRILAMPASSAHGIDVDAVEETLAAGVRPAFIYVIPEAHNPLGGRMSVENRQRLASLARRYETPVLEDDTYGLLTYDDGAPPPLRAFDEQWVAYLGSFSKILSPALRVGWIVAPEELQEPLSSLKHGSDLDTATFGQRTLSAYLDTGGFPEHLEGLRSRYRERRDALLDALAEHFPSDEWNTPGSGIYVWLRLDPDIDTMELLEDAIDGEGVAFCPSRIFVAGDAPDDGRGLRLAFGNVRPDLIGEGVARLARAVERYRARARRPLESLAS